MKQRKINLLKLNKLDNNQMNRAKGLGSAPPPPNDNDPRPTVGESRPE